MQINDVFTNFSVLLCCKFQSHQIGPGPEFERVLFNIQGRSPLVAHYLHMKDLTTNEKYGRNVRRTEVAKLQYPLYIRHLTFSVLFHGSMVGFECLEILKSTLKLL